MQREIVRQIVQLRDQFGFAVIFITHDMSLLLEIADRIAIMYAGKIIEDGGSKEVYRRARHPYTRGLISSFPPLHGSRRRLQGIPGSPPDFSTLGEGCPFLERCPFSKPECEHCDVRLAHTGIDGDAVDHEVACALYRLGTPAAMGNLSDVHRVADHPLHGTVGECFRARVTAQIPLDCVVVQPCGLPLTLCSRTRTYRRCDAQPSPRPHRPLTRRNLLYKGGMCMKSMKSP